MDFLSGRFFSFYAVVVVVMVVVVVVVVVVEIVIVEVVVVDVVVVDVVVVIVVVLVAVVVVVVIVASSLSLLPSRVMTILLLSIVPGGRRCIFLSLSLSTPAPFPSVCLSPSSNLFSLSLFFFLSCLFFLSLSPGSSLTLTQRALARSLSVYSARRVREIGGAPRRNLSGRVP